MRSAPLFAAALCGLSLAAVGCAPNTGTAGAGEILIGATIELTGSASVIGSAHNNALRLAADQVNDVRVHGKRIRLIVKDNRSDPAAAAQNVKTLAADGVVAIVGGATTGTASAAATAAEKAAVPLIALGPSAAVLEPADQRKFVFRTPPNPDAVVDTLIREFAVRDIRSIGIMAVRGSYGDVGVAALQAGATQRNIRIAGIERYAETDADVDLQAGRFANARPDAVVVWAPVPGAGLAARSLRGTQYQDRGGKVYYDAGVGAELFLRDAGSAAEGALVVNPTILAINQTAATTPSVLAQQEFVVKYTQRYGTFSGYASYSADALWLIATAIRDADAESRPAIRAALEKVSYEGLSGSYEFSPQHHGGVSGDALSVLQVRDNGWALAP